ncbi:hypothetical protein MMC22_010066 [Lobaria immixta]|nr:hypothetical protein [Lobaria immixta]
MESFRESVASSYNTVKRALSTAPPNDAYLHWDAPRVEKAKPDEEIKALEIAETMNKMQIHNFDQHRHAFRATHVKTQGIVKGTLTPGPRGLALVVFGVSGERLEGVSSDVSTQGFFFNNAPMLELNDIDTTLEIMRLRERYFDDPAGLSRQLLLRTDLVKQNAPAMLPNTNIISHTMFSQSAFRFGDYYGHMALLPAHKSMDKPDKVKSDHPPSVLSDWLLDHFQGSSAIYEFRIQLGTSPDHHPTEDASVVWDEVTAPYQTIGTLEFPPQDAFSPERRVFWEDHLRLSPWQGLAAHRPLGSVNRLRKTVYEQSQKKRDMLNAKKSTYAKNIEDMP